MIKFVTVSALVLSLSGCASTWDAVALHHDRADPCQGESATPERKRELGRPDNYKRPDYCFAAAPRARTVRLYSPSGQLLGYTR